MALEQSSHPDPRVREALADLARLVSDRHPRAKFRVARGGDNPEGIHLIVTVDLDDPDEVLDLVMDRVLHYQDEGLPVHVIPLQPLRRVVEGIRASPRPARPRIDWGAVRPPA